MPNTNVLLNLCDTSHRVQNRRDGVLRDFTFDKNEIVVTPAGIRSGWRWFGTSDVIVVTLDPGQVQAFAHRELGIILDHQQLVDLPQFSDADLCNAGIILRDALETDDLTSGVMFEAMSRVFWSNCCNATVSNARRAGRLGPLYLGPFPTCSGTYPRPSGPHHNR
ncbi:hypothetical protein [Falsiruegeria mediterranea]